MSSMRVKLNMTKMKDAEAKFVSLVRRSANQIPFRIVKADEETTMVDLLSISRVITRKGDKSDPKKTPCKVAAVVVKKSDDMAPVKEAIVKAGFSVDAMTENADGSVVFSQEENAEGGVPTRISENLVVVLKGFEPWSADIKSFYEQVGMDGYMEGIYTACYSLREVIRKSVYAAADHGAMMTAAQTHLNDFQGYVLAILNAIPKVAYELDDALSTVTKSATPPPAVEEKPMSEKKPEEKPVETVVKTDDVPATVSTPAPEAAPEPKKDETLEKVLKAVEGLAATITDLQGKIAAQGTKIDATATALETVEKSAKESVAKADALEKKLTGTVVADAPDGDKPAKETAVKADEDTTGLGYGFYDSALASRRKK